MLNQIFNKLLIGFINGLITVFTFTTLPLYYYRQKPWIRLQESQERTAAREDSLDPASPWRRISDDPKVEAFEAQSVDSLLEIAVMTNGKNYPIAGVKVLDENKYFYDWITYGHVLRRVYNIAKGLHLEGITAGEKVLIFAETRLEWILCAFAVFKLGGVVTTLFAQLGSEGIIHGINQVKFLKFCLTLLMLVILMYFYRPR